MLGPGLPSFTEVMALSHVTFDHEWLSLVHRRLRRVDLRRPLPPWALGFVFQSHGLFDLAVPNLDQVDSPEQAQVLRRITQPGIELRHLDAQWDGGSWLSTLLRSNVKTLRSVRVQGGARWSIIAPQLDTFRGHQLRRIELDAVNTRPAEWLNEHVEDFAFLHRDDTATRIPLAQTFVRDLLAATLSNLVVLRLEMANYHRHAEIAEIAGPLPDLQLVRLSTLILSGMTQTAIEDIVRAVRAPNLRKVQLLPSFQHVHPASHNLLERPGIRDLIRTVFTSGAGLVVHVGRLGARWHPFTVRDGRGGRTIDINIQWLWDSGLRPVHLLSGLEALLVGYGRNSFSLKLAIEGIVPGELEQLVPPIMTLPTQCHMSTHRPRVEELKAWLGSKGQMPRMRCFKINWSDGDAIRLARDVVRAHIESGSGHPVAVTYLCSQLSVREEEEESISSPEEIFSEWNATCCDIDSGSGWLEPFLAVTW